MPYIICINQPGCLPEADPTAVATIEEARDVAWEHVTDSGASVPDDPQFHNAVTALPEAGGTIGPLPDGYVIDVQRVPLEDLANQVDLNIDPDNHGVPVATEAEVLDAYNQN